MDKINAPNTVEILLRTAIFLCEWLVYVKFHNVQSLYFGSPITMPEYFRILR